MHKNTLLTLIANLAIVAIVTAGCDSGKTDSTPNPASGSSATSSSGPSSEQPTPNSQSPGVTPESKGPEPTSPSEPNPGSTNPPKKTAPATLPNNKRIPPPDDNGWFMATDMTPEALAARADRAIAGFSNMTVKTQMFLTSSLGRGTGRHVSTIEDAKNYQIQYIDTKKGDTITGDARSKNGKAIVRHGYAQKPHAMTAADGPPTGDALANSFAMRMPEFWLAPFLYHRNIFSEYVKLARSTPDAKVSVDRRELPMEGRNVVNYRLVVTRLNKTRVEVVFDANLGFPVSARTTAPNAKKGLDELMWGASYEHKIEKPAAPVKPKKGKF